MEGAGKGVSLKTLERRLAVGLFCLSLAGVVGAVQHDTRVKTLVETSYVLGTLPPAYGNLTLPEPAVINDYLRTSTTLRNYLLPSDPALQLIKCEAYLLQMGALFNFYVVEHPKGCQVPPPLAPWPEREYSAIGRFWFFTLRSWLCLGWLGVLAIVGITIGVTERLRQICRYQRRDQPIRFENWLVVITLLSVMASFFVSIVLATSWSEDLKYLESFNLPDPDTELLNSFLQTSNVSLSLHRCEAKTSTRTIHGPGTLLFHFYIGMPEDMCAQILAAGAPYGKYLVDGPPTWFVDSGRISLISVLSPLATLSSSAVLLFDLVYLLCYVG